MKRLVSQLVLDCYPKPVFSSPAAARVGTEADLRLPCQTAVVEPLFPAEDDVQSPPQVVGLQCHDLTGEETRTLEHKFFPGQFGSDFISRFKVTHSLYHTATPSLKADLPHRRVPPSRPRLLSLSLASPRRVRTGSALGQRQEDSSLTQKAQKWFPSSISPQTLPNSYKR